MKKKILLAAIWIFAILLLSAFFKDFIFDTAQRRCAIASATFGKNNERAASLLSNDATLIYRIYYMSLVSAGTLKISKSEREEGPVFSFEALSDGSIVNAFVHASARLESFFDKQTNMPTRYSETTKVKDVVKNKDIEFDRANHIAICDGKKIRITENVYDPVGAFVTAFNFPYKNGQEYQLDLLSKNTPYELKAKLVALTNDYIETLFLVKRKDQESSHDTVLHVWLTNGSVRIPLMIKCWSPAGYVSAILEKIEIGRPTGENS